jgi:hypothetical protein
MMKKFALSTLAIAALAATACQDTSAPSSDLALSMASVYSAAPAGVSSLSTSFDATGSEGAFAPGFDRGPGGGHGHGPGGPGFGGPGFGLGFMGGGLLGDFHGDGIGRGRLNPSSSHCAFTAGSGVVCADTTRDGLVATKTIKYTSAAGALQSAYDSATTSSVAVASSVSGTATRRDSSKSVISASSSQTIAGLLTANRTVNGASASTETTTGTSREGAFTAKRTAGDTIIGVVIPKATTTNTRPYPTAGKVVRSMSATVTITGQAATTTSRKETITYDGTATAKVVIVKDGTTQNCTLPLPHGRLTCE